MPRYFFDVQDGPKTTIDSDGTELENVRNARREAIETLAQIAHEELPADGDHRNLAIHVADEAHRPIFAVRVDFHVEAEGNGRDA
jgi:hypothetical protein